MAIWRNTILICFVILVICGQVQAQQPPKKIPISILCIDGSDVAPTLKAEHGESVTHMGVTKGGGLIQVYVADQSWTITIRVPEFPHVECLLSNGSEWRAVPEGAT